MTFNFKANAKFECTEIQGVGMISGGPMLWHQVGYDWVDWKRDSHKSKSIIS